MDRVASTGARDITQALDAGIARALCLVVFLQPERHSMVVFANATRCGTDPPHSAARR